MTAAVTFHGDHAEGLALAEAAGRNCECEFGLMGVRTSVCLAHTAIATDQRLLNGLVFMRRQADRLRREEFST